MAQPTVLGGVIEFFDQIGIYDVVLPFLLVFTIMFAILEKTKVLGTDEIDKVKYPKKNLNAMTAFVVAFLVIASARLVETITEVSSNVVILLLLAVFFLMLVGAFIKPSAEGAALEGWWKIIFMIIMFIGIAFIFLNAIKTEAGETWLEVFIDWLGQFWSSAAVASIIFVIFIIAIIMYITAEKRPAGSKTKERED